MPHNDSPPDPALVAGAIIDANQYLTLATADGDGHHWAAPVWYAHDDYRDFLWVSRPEARHSRNIAARPELAIVIFDSTVPAGTGQAVYAEALAEELDGPERDRASRCSPAGPNPAEPASGARRTSPRQPSSASTGREHRRTSSSTPTTGASRSTLASSGSASRPAAGWLPT